MPLMNQCLKTPMSLGSLGNNLGNDGMFDLEFLFKNPTSFKIFPWLDLRTCFFLYKYPHECPLLSPMPPYSLAHKYCKVGNKNVGNKRIDFYPYITHCVNHI
jgi:hypothetical protein